MAMPTDTGLVILERRGSLDIRSFGADPMGDSREELVRLLVVNEAGTRQASFDVTGDEEAEIKVLEGRTVGPDGKVTPLDETRDIRRVDILGRRRSDPVVSLATVSQLPGSWQRAGWMDGALQALWLMLFMAGASLVAALTALAIVRERLSPVFREGRSDRHRIAA